MAYSSLVELLILPLVGLLDVLLVGTYTSYSSLNCTTNFGSIEETMFSMAIYTVVVIAKLGPLRGKPRHDSHVLLPLCELGKLLLISVSNMSGPIVLNLFFSFGTCSLLEPSMVNLSSVSSSSFVVTPI